MRAKVITLHQTPKRLETFQKEWAGTGSPFFLEVHYGTYTPSAPSTACGFAHREALHGMVEPVMMFEDDAAFANGIDWYHLPLVPDDAVVIYLGGQHMDAAIPQGDGLVRCRQTWRTHAYIAVKPQVLSATISSRGPNERLGDVFMRSGPCYAYDPFIVGQRADKSLIGLTRRQTEFWNKKGKP